MVVRKTTKTCRCTTKKATPRKMNASRTTAPTKEQLYKACEDLNEKMRNISEASKKWQFTDIYEIVDGDVPTTPNNVEKALWEAEATLRYIQSKVDMAQKQMRKMEKLIGWD